MSKSSTLNFIDWRKPQLVAGFYEMTVTQSVAHLPPGAEHTNTDEDHWTFLRGLEQKVGFHVTAPRWRIPEGQVDRVFPPPGSQGDYSRFFPYVLIDNPTLPWERTPYATAPDEAKPAKPSTTHTDAPWMALILIDDSLIDDTPNSVAEPATGRIRLTQATPAKLATPGVATPALAPESTDQTDSALSVVDIPTLLDDQLGLSAIRTTRHSCVVQSPDAQALGKEGEHALITCPDTPESGRYQLMLISLEGWLDGADGKLTKTEDTIKHRRFICLGHWLFSCHPEKAASFSEIAASVGVSLLVAPKAIDNPNKQAGGYLLPMRQRNGTEIQTWRRGPLVPARIRVPAEHDPWQVRSAEALILDGLNGSPPDVSYAEAWEQGRFAALSKPVLAAALADYRRASAHQTTGTGYLLCGETCSAPPDAPTTWLSALLRLEYTPYTTLVPSPALLPAEQARFFLVDPHWLECFLAGAISLGRPYASGACHHMEDSLRSLLKDDQKPPVAGMLLRSRLVTGWPELEVMGHSDTGDVETVRVSRPAPNILMTLFAQEIHSVSIAPPAHHLHFKKTTGPTANAAEWAAKNAVVKETALFSMRTT